MTLFLAKIAVSAGIVISVTAAAERWGPRLGGFVASLPQLAVVSLIFFGLEQGLEFAGESAFWNIPGICATIPFYIGYIVGGAAARKLRILSIVTGTIVGTILFAVSAAILGNLTIDRRAVLPLAAGACAAALWLVRRLPDTAPLQRVRMSLPLVVTRAALASVAVLALTSLAHLLGPKWSGLLTGFPVNGLPVIAVLHFHYGLDVIKTMVKIWPLGIFGICLFNLVAWLTVERLGLFGSIVLGYLVDIIYLAVANAARRAWFTRSPHSTVETGGQPPVAG
jgi:hypothetical protein